MLLKEAVTLAHQLGQSGKKCWIRKLQELFNAAGLPSTMPHTKTTTGTGVIPIIIIFKILFSFSHVSRLLKWNTKIDEKLCRK